MRLDIGCLAQKQVPRDVPHILPESQQKEPHQFCFCQSNNIESTLKNWYNPC